MDSPLGPGKIFTADFRTHGLSGTQEGGSGPLAQKSIRILQWNIERGYELEKV
jgi:hypothetical protein